MTRRRSSSSRGAAGWALLLCLWACGVRADALAGIEAIQAMYRARFPTVATDDYVLGAYAIDPALRAQWEQINEFPPYEFAIDEGRTLFETALPDGTLIADCLPGGGVGTAHTWPHILPAGEIDTLPLAINRCRTAHGAKPWAFDRGPMVAVLTYLASTSREQRQAVALPSTDAARAALETGQALFMARRGSRNFSCYGCHVTAAGKHLREQTLAPLWGAANHYPVYGLGWGAMGTLHARFAGCFEMSGATALASQSPEYRALEYFLAVLGRGLPWIAPGLTR